MSVANSPPKAASKPPPGSRMTAYPSTNSSAPMAAKRGSSSSVRLSIAERVSADRGVARVASRAGGNAAIRVAPIPSASPSSSDSGAGSTPRTETTK